jgi:hypothetical protein
MVALMRSFFVHEGCCTVVKGLAQLIIPTLADDSGVAYGTIHGWFKRHSPSVSNMQSVLHAMGYELVIRKRDHV